MPQEAKDKIHQFLVDTLPVFLHTKEYVTFVDTFSEGSLVPIAPLNELRNALFHLYRIVDEENRGGSVQEDILEAKEHIYRARFDSYSILCSILIEKIADTMKPFKRETIVKVFPTYYKDIVPEISSIQMGVATSRTVRNTNLLLGNSSHVHLETAPYFLFEKYQLIQTMIPELVKFEEDERLVREEREERERKQKSKDIYKDKFIWFIGAVLVALLTFFLGKYTK